MKETICRESRKNSIEEKYSTNVLYRINNISKSYKLNKISVEALKNISLTLEKNISTAFIGPSGSGKSTLLHILGSIDSPDSGNVLFNEINLSLLNDEEHSRIRSEKIGFIFQNFNLIPVLNVFENIEYPLRMRCLQKGQIGNRKISQAEKEKILEVIEEVGLKDHLKHKPGELSGGQRQRVAVARALVIEPEVILADEPTANLDSKTGLKILELIKRLSEKHKTTPIFSTHDPKVIEFVEKKITLCDGEIINKE